MGDLRTTTTSRDLVPRAARQAGSAGQEIASRLAQRRAALLLLPLRLWVGIGWLRYGVAKALQPEWFDGTAITGFLGAQPEAAAPLSLYTDLLTRVVERAAAPLGIVILCAEIAIGVGLLTGTLTNLALLTAIALNVNFLVAGGASPSQYYIVIQVVLLAGGAGAAYSGDRLLSRVMPSVLLTGHRGLVDGVDAPRSLLVVLAVITGGLALAVVPAIGQVLPRQGVDDPAFALVALLMLVALFAVALTRASHRPSAEQTDDWSEIGEGYGVAQLPPRPGHQHPEMSGVNGANGASGRIPPQPPPAPSQRPPAQPQRPPAPSQRPPAQPQRPPVPSQRPPAQPQRPPARSTPVAQQAPPQRPPPPQQDPWPSSVPPPTQRPAVQDQPTTQFVRPRRSRDPHAPADPYAELRDLPPVQEQ